MATIVTKSPITAEEFLDMDLGEGQHELVRGVTIEVTQPGRRHGLVCGRIGRHLGNFGAETGFGYVLTNDTAIVTQRGPDTVRGAGLMFYSNAQIPESEVDDALTEIPPILVVEVYSPSNRPSEILEKVHESLNAGVPMVWVVHPRRRTVAIYRPGDPIPAVLTDRDVVEGLPELPGSRCPVAEFFP